MLSVCLCGCLSAYFFPPFGCDSDMTCYSMLACLYTFPVLFIPICVRLCYLGSLSYDKWSQNWLLPQLQSCSSPSVHIGEPRTRLRSFELRECSFDIWCHCSCLLVRSAGLLWRLRLGPGREAVVWPSSDVSSSWHDRGKHESWGGEWPIWTKNANIIVQSQFIIKLCCAGLVENKEEWCVLAFQKVF